MNLERKSQFFYEKGNIDVSILKVIAPSHFILKECPSLNMSKGARDFQNLEQDMNQYYELLEKGRLCVPQKNDVVAIFSRSKRKCYRAKVNSIISTTKGNCYNVYLLDYGKTVQVKRESLFEIKSDYLTVPFQAVNFHLMGIRPLSLILNPLDLSASYGPAKEWDKATEEYVDGIWKDVSAVQVNVVGYDKYLEFHGLMYIHTNADFVSLNKILIDQERAYFDEAELQRITVIGSLSGSDSDDAGSTLLTKSEESRNAATAKGKKMSKEDMAALHEVLRKKLEQVNATPCSIGRSSNSCAKVESGIVEPDDQLDHLSQSRMKDLPQVEGISGSASPTSSPTTSCDSSSVIVQKTSVKSQSNSPQNLLLNQNIRVGNLCKSISPPSPIFTRDPTSRSISEIVSPISSEGGYSRQDNEINSTPRFVGRGLSPTAIAGFAGCHIGKTRNIVTGIHAPNHTDQIQLPIRKSVGRGALIQAFSNRSPVSCLPNTNNNDMVSNGESTQVAKQCIITMESLCSSNCQSSDESMYQLKGKSPPIVSERKKLFKNDEIAVPLFSSDSPVPPTVPSSTGLINCIDNVVMTSTPRPKSQSVGRGTLLVPVTMKPAAETFVENLVHCSNSPDIVSPAEVQSVCNVMTPMRTMGRGSLIFQSSGNKVEKDVSVDVPSLHSASSDIPLCPKAKDAVPVACPKIRDSCQIIKKEPLLLGKETDGQFENCTVTTSKDLNLGIIEYDVSSNNSYNSEKDSSSWTVSQEVSPVIANRLTTQIAQSSFLKNVTGGRGRLILALADAARKSSLITSPPSNAESNLDLEKAHITRGSCDSSPTDAMKMRSAAVGSSLLQSAEGINEMSVVASSCCAPSNANNSLLKGRDSPPIIDCTVAIPRATDEADTVCAVPESKLAHQEDIFDTSVQVAITHGKNHAAIIAVDASKSASNNTDVSLDSSDTESTQDSRNRSSGAENGKIWKSSDFLKNPNSVDPYFKTNLDFSGSSLFEQQGVPALQIGGMVMTPILRTEDAPFGNTLHQCLKQINFWGPSCIQSVVWPAVFRGRSFIAVAPPHSGKSVSYLLPILSAILHRSDYAHLPASNAPIAIILCSSWKKVQAVNQQTQLFLNHCGKVSVITGCNDEVDVKKKKQSLLNGCDVLISTPTHLLDYLNQGVTSFKRCCHFILDDGNALIKWQSKLIVELMKLLLECWKMQKGLINAIQIGVCVERWTRSIASFAKKFQPSHLLFFTSFLESAVYCQVPTHVHMCTEATKSSAVLDLLKSVTGTKILICTVDSDSATEIHRVLTDAAVDALLAHESMYHFLIEGVKNKWKMHCSPNPVVLVLTDAAILNMNINDADCLIHFDLPEMSRLQFSYRYGCIAQHFVQVNERETVNCVNHIFITEKCETQAASLVTTLHRMEAVIPEALHSMAIIQKQIQTNENAALCGSFLSCGLCLEAACKERHVFLKELDCPSVIPRQGDVRVIVNHVFDATHYCVQILRYVDPVTCLTVSRTAEYAKLSISLQDFFSCTENLAIEMQSFELNAVCCVREKTGVYHRAKILNFHESSEDVTLMFLDEGWVRKFPKNKLLELPDKFKDMPAIAAEAYLCNVKPSDFCNDWNPEASHFIFDRIGGREVDGKIVLCIGNILFLDPIVVRETKLSFIKEGINLFNVGRALKTSGFAVDNKHHLVNLLKACEGQVEHPLLIKKKEVAPRPEVNWAFLDLLTEEDVFVSHIESPHQFYVHRTKFTESLDKMNADIKKRVEKKLVPPCQILLKGSYCLAPIPEDNNYYRGEIMDLTEENGETVAHIFFVDFGDSSLVPTNQLLALPPDLVLFPFQAIECELWSVDPPHGGWTSSAIDYLFDITRDETDLMQPLKIKAWKKTARYTGGNHYCTDLFMGTENVADFLVEEGMAIQVETLIDDCPSHPPAPPSEEPVVLSSDTEVSLYDGQLSCTQEPEVLMSGILALMKSNNEKLDSLKQSIQQEKTKLLKEHFNTGLEPNGKYLLDDWDSSVQNGSVKAKITWWNTKENCYVTIHLPDIKIYDVDYGCSGFKFSSLVNERHYCIQENFYADIEPKKTQAYVQPHGIDFIFLKQVAEKWPRLIKDTKKMFYIKYDLLHLDTDSEDENANIPISQVSPTEPDCEDTAVLHFDDSDLEENTETTDNTCSWSRFCEDSVCLDLRT